MNQQDIKRLINNEFNPTFLDIINESHLHASGKGANSHFKIILVSDFFDGKRAVARHQAVYKLLSEGLEQNIHALSLHIYTSDEWANVSEITASPNCAGVGQ